MLIGLAGMAELADALESGSSVLNGRGGSTPFTRIEATMQSFTVSLLIFAVNDTTPVTPPLFCLGRLKNWLLFS